VGLSGRAENGGTSMVWRGYKVRSNMVETVKFSVITLRGYFYSNPSNALTAREERLSQLGCSPKDVGVGISPIEP
jgi:hypothetical protein